MVRETRHLWVGNLPDNIREDRIREHFKRYGRVQNVKLLGRADNIATGVNAGGASGVCATVAFMDIKSASKAHNAEHVLDERTFTTEYYEPAAIPSAAGAPSAGSSPAGSGYSGSSSSVNSTPAPASVSRYHLSGGEDSSSNTCPLAASAAAPAAWRGTNDSATEYCRRGNTPAAYGRYQRNNSNAPYSTPPSNVERTTPHHRWYASSDRVAGATGGESTPSTPGGGTEGGRRRRNSGSGSSRSDSSSPEPSDTSRASTPATQPPLSHHNNHRTPPSLQHQWASTASGRPLAICVRNLPTRSTDSSLKDGLYHEYKKHGKVVWVKVVGQNADRYAVVRFKKPSDVEKALEVSQDKLFFGCKITVAPHQSCDEDADSAKPYETDIDEYHPKATRTLFIGNLEKDVTQQQLRDKFKLFGRIIEIDIKKGSSGGAGYAFCQYASISSVVEAIRAMDGENVGGTRVKLGFGKPVATTCVWVDGLTEHTEKQVLSAVSRCGGATSVCVDRAAGAALVHFEQAAAAGAAVRELRRVAAAVSAAEPDHPRLCVDYASRECQEAFYEQLEKHGGSAALTGSERLSGDLASRYLPSTRHEPIRFDGSGSRSRASSYGRGSSRTPRYSALEPYDPTDYAADRRYRVYDEVGSSPQPEDTPYEERLQSVVVSPHRARRHRRDSSPDDRKHSKERHRSVGTRRSRSGSRGGDRHGARRRHRRRRDGSGSHSRAGTPLRDEPDAAPPAEPRRAPRERPPLPMSLPLPKFAVQLMRTAPTTPRPSPAPAPDSPPRPPSASSSSGGSAPHSPSLEERIRSLDEKLNGSRVPSEAPDRARLRHRLLEVDINEVKPSEVVRSLLAKRSVFDEDSERLEGAGRAPSPGSSPRGRLAAPTPRALRYPFPAHADDDELGVSRLLASLCHEVRGRPRTPPPPPPPPEPEPAPEPERDHTPEQNDHSRQFDTAVKNTDKQLDDYFSGEGEGESLVATGGTEDSADGEDSDLTSRDRHSNLSIASTSLNSQTTACSESQPTAVDSNLVKGDIFNHDDRTSNSLTFHLEDNSAREVMEMLLKRVENFNESQNYESQFDKICKYNKESLIKSELHKHEERLNIDSENKLDPYCQTDNHKSREIHENHITKELIEFEMQQNHLNTVNSIKSNIAEFNQEFMKNTDKILKDRHNHSGHNAKLEKENIQFDKAFEKERNSIITALPDKKNTDLDKNHDDRVKMDRDKIRHCKEKIPEKEKNEMEKDKSKSSKSERNIDKRPKEDQHSEKNHNDKSKDGERNQKDKSDKEFDKLKHSDEKSYRHDHHKKERSDREKRKDSVDNDYISIKPKKDEKHKHDRSKKDHDSKRESKKETESVKNRKSSRDETSRELCRKDSTDSSTSRASHESSKLKDLEISETKDDTKPKLKLTELFVKHQGDLLSKSEIKEEKESASHKNKNENTLEHNVKSKGEMSEKQRHYSLDSPSVDTKRKERLNSCSSLPSNIGHKRRMSSQDSIDIFNEDIKKGRSDLKISERRESKESRTENRHKTAKFSKGHFAKIIESKTKDDKKNQVKPPDENFVENKGIESKDTKPVDRVKSFKKSSGDENEEKPNMETATEGLQNDLDFLATLELRSSEEDERQRALRKEMKEKKRIQQLQQIQELQLQRDALHPTEFMGKTKEDKKQKCDEKKKEIAREKRMSTDRKSRDEKIDNTKRKSRKPVHSSDSSDSDEPKKHSIFDIIDDGPTYISMYDKVKARSCKNMQKQEEEKRQEKIKAKFSQLKQSRAKREEKKRSSWDEDSDSDQDRKKYQSMDNSSDDDIVIHTKKREKSHSYDYDPEKTDEYFDGSTNEEDLRNKLSRKNSRTRIMSDTSDDEASKRSISKSPSFLDSIKKELLSDSESTQRTKIDDTKESNEIITKKNSLLNLFGKSDSDDSKLKLNLDNDNGYKSSYIKSMCNDFSSESESACNKNTMENRRKHKKKQKKHKSSYSDDEKIENSDTSLLEGYKHKNIENKRRHSTKKDKRKEKLRDSIDTDENRDEKNKLKREKKIANNNFDIMTDTICNAMRKDGKMEDIFGPLSDESDRDTRNHVSHKLDFSSHEIEPSFCTNNSDYKMKEKDERRRKEKKRKENRFFKEDDNSLDVDAVSKAIEARLFADTLIDDDSRLRAETLSESLSKFENSEMKYAEGNIISEMAKQDKFKKECKEKKRKKKKSREDRQSRKEHHNFYHQDKLEKTDQVVIETAEVSPKTMLLDIPLPNDEQTVSQDDKIENRHSPLGSQSLPRLTDSPPISIQSDENTDSKSVDSNNVVIDDNKMDYVESKEIEIEEIPMPPPFEQIVTDISEVPLPKDPLPSKVNNITEDSVLSSFSSDGDTCEDAVRNIISSETDSDKTEKSSDIVEMSPCKSEKKIDEKPRAIISQEETEDAVAALLGESFGGKINTFSSCYEESENISTHPNEIEIATIENENIPEEDAEEMRQAVQNLNASEMEMKPDTPVSDSDLLLIDTDTEETDETPQDSIEKLPVNIIATNQALNTGSDQKKCPEVSNNVVSDTKTSSLPTVTTTNDSNIKVKDTDVKIQLTKRENIQVITSTATPVITSWTLTNNKLLEPHVLNIQANSIPGREKNELKPTHITANIVQIKGPTNQNVQLNNTARPVMTQTRVSAPYQVINQMIRTQTPNMQPPTIKIPEPHILYQKPQGIVISPRMSNDPRLQSPKASSQGESMTSPRLTNMAILSTSPQNLNSAGMASPNAIQQRSPGQVTVVRMQQPPLSPIQTMHLPHGARTMLSPNRPNSVLVQTQGTPIHFNRLPITPVLTPISKQMNVNNLIQQNKGISVTTSPLIHQQKIISGDGRKSDPRNMSENTNENTKIILSPTNLQHSTNPTVMAQNRLISMQNAIHVSNMNTVHLNNKVVINTVSQLNDKRENQSQKSDKISHIPFGSTPIIHVAAVNNATSSIIQGNKSVAGNIQEASTINRSQGSNVIHSLGSQRLLSQAPLSNVIKIDTKKGPASVLSMATIRPPSSVLAKLGLCASTTTTTTSVTNVSPLLLKTTCSTGPVKLNTKFDKDNKEPLKPLVLQNELKVNEKPESIIPAATVEENVKDKTDIISKPIVSPVEHIVKGETDFEELLKDNTNEIKITNDPEKKLEINVGKTITLITRKENRDKVVSNNLDGLKAENVLNTNQSQFSTITSVTIEKRETSETKEENMTSQPKEIAKVSSCVENNSVQATLPSIPVLKEKTDVFGSDKTAPCGNELLNIKNVIKSDEPNFDLLLPGDSPGSGSPIKTDENDSWSGKDVNLESVIKKVDSLCNESAEISQKTDEITKEVDPIKLSPNISDRIINHTPHIKSMTINPPIENVIENKIVEETVIDKVTPAATAKRGGRSVRGRKVDKSQDRVQTRQISKPTRGGASAKRGRGRAKVDKKIKAFVNSTGSTMPGDVYDFHEDSGDETATSPNKTETRPRLILTIKSPLSGHSSVTATSTLSIAQKEQMKFEKNKEEKNEEFISPSTNTRKSRRLQEKDVQRSTVDDVIEDVIKGPVGQIKPGKESNKKRPTRQAVVKATQEKSLGSDTRKSPRGAKRTRDRSLSDASVDSGDERNIRDCTRDPKAPRLDELEPEAASVPHSSAPVTTAEPVAPAPSPAPAVAVPPAAPGPLVPTTSHAPPATLVPPATHATPVTHALPTTLAPPATHAQPTIHVPPTSHASSTTLAPTSSHVPVIPHAPHGVLTTHTPAPPSSTSTPITKPPKKMISEISAKLAGAFEAVVGAASVVEAAPPPLAPGGGDAARGRRMADGVPGALVPVGGSEASDARVQSPALPHRPPSAPSTAPRGPPERATPLLIRSVSRAAARPPQELFDEANAHAFRYADAASLPRGAHHPPHPAPDHLKQVQVLGPQPLHHPGAASRVTIASVPAISPQGQIGMGDGMYPHFSHQHYQMYQQHFRATQHESRATPSPYSRSHEAEGSEAPTPPLELRRPPGARVPAADLAYRAPDVLRRAPHAPPAPHAPHAPLAPHAPHAPLAPAYGVGCGRSPPPAHGTSRHAGALPPGAAPGPAPGPPHASQVPREADSLQMLLRRYPVMWQGLLALKNDSAAVQMHFVGGNPGVAGDTLSRHADGSTPLLRIAQRMRLEQPQLEQVHRKMKMENEHCMLLALPCGRDHMDVLQQSTNLTAGFITYLQRKQAAGIVNIAPPGHHQAMFTVHIFPSCEFANENLNRIAPDLMHRVADIAHLLIVIATATA
ncbi:hypothetical protein PYW07_005199 [Mythimna separata]|uniref:Protein split ends n=1 Tax=Mythimna separata TaxID=271217 RepID=A0AAD8DPR0_MYTSE|nr:hypothetical protein PYW07_005199 [Mythimna separata]